MHLIVACSENFLMHWQNDFKKLSSLKSNFTIPVHVYVAHGKINKCEKVYVGVRR